MRTKNEKLICPIAEDLIDIVSLSRMCAAREGMELDEASDFVTDAIVGDDEVIEVYRTDKPGLPVCIGEINSKVDFTHVLDALWMPFRSRWWENPASLTVIQAGWDVAPDSVAIRWTDAARILDLTPPDQARQPELSTTALGKRIRKHNLDHVIKQAKTKCSDPTNMDHVWGALVILAKEKSFGLTGGNHQRIQYMDSNDKPKTFNKKQLTAYLNDSNLKRKRPPKSAQ